MDEEDGFVSFKVSQWDRDNEFNINRPKKRMSKNQATYGIWAESDSEEESDKKGRGGGGGSKQKDYSAPVAFVSGGIKDDSKSKSDKHVQQEDSKKSKKQAPLFSGFAGVRNFGSHSGGGDIGNWEMYTKGVGSKLLQKMGYQPGKGLGKNLQGITAPIEAKKRQGSGAIGLYGPEMTEQAKVTEKQLADKEKKDDIEMIDIDESKEKEWKKSKTEKMKRPEKKVKIFTKSTEEIIADSVKNSWNNKTSNDFQRMKIIDMTGPQKKMLSGLSQLHQSKAEKPKDDYSVTAYNTRFDMPELKANIERLVRLSETKLVKCDKDYYRDQDQVENLCEEKARLIKLLSQEKEQLSIVDKFEIFIENLEQKVGRNELTFEQAILEFESFSNVDQRPTLRTLGYDNLIICTVGSLLSNELNLWKPFTDLKQDEYVQLFQRLKAITFKSKTFEIILWEHWIPIVCRAMQNWPSMKQFEEIIAFVERWSPLIPKWMLEYFVGNNLMPRILREVEDWNPLTDMLPIHSWIHPWLPVLLVDTSSLELEERSFLFESIYEIIRMKLANALTNWHPSDSSARLILEPWKGVFTEPSFQTFLEINIVPKLADSMQSLVINPSQQNMDQWDWVLSWNNLLSSNAMVNILEKHFFPNWLNVLYGWLNSGMANFSEIGAWYQGWKSLLGNDLVNQPVIKELLKKALVMMDHAVNLAGGLKQFASYYDPSSLLPPPVGGPDNPIEIPATVNSSSIIQQAIEQASTAYQAEATLSFKEMVERKAEENGILFMPMANRYQEGKQVFQFDQFLVYIDNQVIFQQKFVQGKRLWTPIRLQELTDLCKK